MAQIDKMTLSGFTPLREAAKATPTGKHLSFSAWLRLAAVERLQRETLNVNTTERKHSAK